MFPHLRSPRLALVLALTTACGTVLTAQDDPATADGSLTVRKIDFEGREWIPEDTLRRAAKLQAGDRWTGDAERRSVDGLRKMEFVAEVSAPRVTVDSNGNVDLVFRIVERDAVQSVRIEGNESVETPTLRDVLGSRPGRPLDQVTLDEDVQALVRVCQQAGYLLADIRATGTRPGPGRVNVVFDVAEGPRIGISEVVVMGNDSVSTAAIVRATGLRPRRLFGVLEVGEFLPDEIDAAMLRLRQLYRSRGFLEARVDLDDVELDVNHREVKITIRVVEGPRFRLGGVILEGNRVFGDDILLPELDLEIGASLSNDALEKASRRLVEIYQERSDRVPRIVTRVRHGLEGEDVTAVFEIDERRHLFVGEVRVEGNWRTLDRVILARSDALPGNALSLFSLEDTARKIRALGFFDDVRVETRPTERPDVLDVLIEVDEAEEIGRWEVGGGASSGEGGVGYLRIEHPNVNLFKLPRSPSDWSGAFSGGGQSLAVEFVPGDIESQYRASFLEPYFFSTHNSLELQGTGFLFDRGPYDESRFVADVEARQELGLDERLSAALAFRAESIEIDDVAVNAPATVVMDQGSAFLTYPRIKVRYSNLSNNAYSGPQGFLAELRGDIASSWTGSDFDFARARLDLDSHISFFDDDDDLRHSLHVGLDAGWIDGLGGDRVPFFESWFVGGPRSFRGFEYREMGPHQAREPIGGGVMVHGTIEYSLPLFLRELRAVVLLDWGMNEADFGDLSAGKMRTAAGGGIQLRVPLLDQVIPVNLFLVQALSSESGDAEQLFSFTLGYGL